MPISLFREMRVAEQAHKAGKQESPEELLRMLESGIRDGWSDKALSHVVLEKRRHATDDRVAGRLEQLVQSGCGAYLRRAVAVVLGYGLTSSNREMLRSLTRDPDKAVAQHAEMSLERLRRIAQSPLG